jgi:hypothetical protein
VRALARSRAMTFPPFNDKPQPSRKTDQALSQLHSKLGDLLGAQGAKTPGARNAVVKAEAIFRSQVKGGTDPHVAANTAHGVISRQLRGEKRPMAMLLLAGLLRRRPGWTSRATELARKAGRSWAYAHAVRPGGLRAFQPRYLSSPTLGRLYVRP